MTSRTSLCHCSRGANRRRNKRTSLTGLVGNLNPFRASFFFSSLTFPFSACASTQSGGFKKSSKYGRSDLNLKGSSPFLTFCFPLSSLFRLCPYACMYGIQESIRLSPLVWIAMNGPRPTLAFLVGSFLFVLFFFFPVDVIE